MNSDTKSFLNEIEPLYTKLNAECKKKERTIKESIEAGLKTIDYLKQQDITNFELSINHSKEIGLLLLPLQKITESKKVKMYILLISIIKLLVQNNIVPLSLTSILIFLLKDIFYASSEDNQLKIADILMVFVNSCLITIEEDTINRLMMICFKLFSIKNTELTNPLKALFISLLKIVYEPIQKKTAKANSKEQNFELANDKQFKCGLSLFKSLIEIIEGKHKEWVAPSTSSKCLALELICNTINNNPDIFINLEQMRILVNQDLCKILIKHFENSNDYLIIVKICRCSVILMNKVKMGFELIQHLIKYSEVKDVNSWIKWLGLESLGSIISNDVAVTKMATITGHKLYEELFSSMLKITKAINLQINDMPSNSTKKKDSSSNSPTNKINSKKGIENDFIFTEGETAPNININIIYNSIIDYYENYKNCLVNILNKKSITVGVLNDNIINETKEELKKQLEYKSELITEALYDNIDKAMDSFAIQSYLSQYQSLISIYGTIGSSTTRDTFLKDLCVLAMSPNVKSINDFTDKNFLIFRSLFNIASCVHLLDLTSLVLIFDVVQRVSEMIIRQKDLFIDEENATLIYNMISSIDYRIKMLSKSVTFQDKKVNEDNTNNENNIVSHVQNRSKSFESNKVTLHNNFNNNNEENCNLLILTDTIDNWLYDSNSYDNNTIILLINSIKENCNELINQNQTPIIINYIRFNLKKMLELAWINHSRIHLIWGTIIETVDIATKANDIHLSQYGIDILSVIIINSILKYEDNTNKKEEWSESSYERTLISSILVFASKNIEEEINLCIIRNLNRILDKCGQKMNTFGWSSFIETCSFILNNNLQKQTELTFQIYEKIFNNFSTRLNAYNIRPLLTSLEIFCSSQVNDMIPYMAIFLFKTCANITENYQKNKVKMKAWEEQFFNDFLPDDKIKSDFYDEIWRNIFSKLLNINSDPRQNVRNSGIDIFADLFANKIENISLQNCDSIISEVFLAILRKNIEIYREKSKTNKEDLIKEWEDTAIFSFQAYSKVLRAYFNYSNDKDKINGYFTSLISICNQILEFCRPEFITSIIKALAEINKSNGNLIMANLNSYWTLINKLISFFNNEDFIKKHNNNNSIASKILFELILNINRFFLMSTSSSSSEASSQNKEYDGENISKFFSIYELLLSLVAKYEHEQIAYSPEILLNHEKEIFDIMDEVAKSTQQKELIVKIYQFINAYLVYDYNNEHSEAIFRKCLISVKLLFSLSLFSYEDYLNDLFAKINEVHLYKNNNNIGAALMKRKPKMYSFSSNEGLYLWSFISIEGRNIIKSFINKLSTSTSNNKEIIWNCIISFIEAIFTQNDICIKTFSKSHQDDYIKSLQEMELDAMNFIINDLVFYSSFTSKEIQSKLLNLIIFAANKDYSGISNISSQISKNNISSLVDLCKYKNEEDIKKEKEKEGMDNSALDKYVSVKVKIAKMFTPILLKRCKEIMKKFLADEIKNGSMPLSKSRIDEIKFILENIKNLEIYPHYTIIDDETHMYDEDGLEEKNTVLGLISNTKKAHLFILHPILLEFISAKENDLKILLKEIFKRISIEMGIKSAFNH